ncbi:hypothetical protein V1503_18695 [Bacillus sp. SCS-151]|uniref:hypothetical protein n=1 Tax=Nanhaiella sioensis TaxID=3115293 RepID=UPI00397C885C
MSQVALKTKIYFGLSVTIFLIGLLSWVPYLVFNIQEPYGVLTLFLNPIGFYVGYLSKNRLIALSNLFMVFSFVPVLIFVYVTKGYIPM